MNYSEIITVPCKILRTLPETEIDSIVDIVIDYYYEHGFPYYKIDELKIIKEYNALCEFDITRLELPNNNLQQFMLGLNTVNTFHPEMWNTQCRNAKTPMDIFLNRELFKTALKKRIKYSVTKLVAYNIRKSLKAFGVQSVSNFKPTIAKWVYQKYCPPNGNVLDPCAGYGGRLFGALCSHVKSYTGIDPNEIIQTGNAELVKILLDSTNMSKNIVLKKIPFEDYNTTEIFDLVFTSPPYFNIEKYSEDNNQSYIRYPKYNLWLNGFLKPLIEKSYSYLRKGGYLVLNVGKPIDTDTFEIGQKIFKQKPETYYMRLSKFLGQNNKNEISHKTEPIFIWKKS
jgi:16S rRNA G966 N2-methylase RsmD